MAGHVIARELGGHGDLRRRPLNIFPQNAALNTNESRFWRRRELEIVRLFRTGCPQVCVRIVFRYDTSGPYPARPTYLIYDLWVDGVQQPTEEGANPV